MNVKIIILSYKISIFTFTKMVLEQRYLEMIAPWICRSDSWRSIFMRSVRDYWHDIDNIVQMCKFLVCMYTVWSDHLRWILWGWSAINWTCSRSLRSVSSKTECFTVFAVSDLIENRLVIYNIYQTKMGESSKKIQVPLMKIQYMYYSPIMTKTKLCNVFSRSE